jgi:putative endonuclease
MTARNKRDSDPRRRAAERRGRRSEIFAAAFLMAKGYRLLARRFRTPLGEIDLVMRRGRTIVFVEVKQRSGESEPRDAVTAAGRRRITRAAELWLARNEIGSGVDFRFDVVVLAPASLPRHYRGLFDAKGHPW